MRAVYIDQDLNPDRELILNKEKTHHLFNVLRMKESEKVLVLNGRGVIANAQIEKLSKKEALLKIESIVEYTPPHYLSLALAFIKKEALEICLREAVELGIHEVYLFPSQFSDKVIINIERLEKIIELSLEQSNNPFKTKLIVKKNINEIAFEKFDFIRSYHPYPFKSLAHKERSLNKSGLIIIGPEGGFSPTELEFMQQKECEFVRLNSFILRSQTAVAAAVGHTLGEFS